MPCAGTTAPVAAHLRTQIFSQRDREIGRFLGIKKRADVFHATQFPGNRCEGMERDANFGISERVIGACIEVHRLLGPGLLESIYEECLCRELTLRGLNFARQKPISIEYKGNLLEQAYRVDLVVEETLLLEIKSVDTLLPIHAAQVVTYLRVAGLPSGLLVNFNALTIRDGLRRLWRNPKISRSPDLFVKKSGSF
jgi:GxxExxY protein